MSEAPEVMWRETIKPNKMYPNGGSFYYEKHKPSTVDTVPYRRADLPPTLSAAMELPEVKALVDAATALLVQVDGLIPIKHPQQKLERNKLRHAITALAAIKETKT